VLRRLILDASHRAHAGHIASALSITDIIAVLFSDVIDVDRRHDPDRDLFMLSKGHASLALYAALHVCGVLSAEQFSSYCADGSLLAVHPEHGLDGVDFATGSLGHALSVAAGAAFGARLHSKPWRSYVLISDAELDEGSTWEAVLFAGHHRLGNLTLIVDVDGQQGLGRTRDVLDLGDVAAKLRSFGWDAAEVNGHDPVALRVALTAVPHGMPRAVVARTVAGHGVSFMEGQIAWHHLAMTDAQYEQALAEVG